ncbi:hypothetical protein B0H19DRAFT_1064365 [Mycena capillaripes]|nr:hypothetical protein B0H19DRAFT_1064365 [Mycena capillaripes]
MLNLSHNAHPNVLGLGPILRILKGSDAHLRIAVEHVGLVTQIKLVYNSGESEIDGDRLGHDVLMDERRMGVYRVDRRGLILRRGKQRLQDIQVMDVKRHGFLRSDRAWVEEGILEDVIPARWVTRLTELNPTSSTYTA